VLVTPPGFGKWDLLFFLFPFLLVAFLWLRGISRARRRRNSRFQQDKQPDIAAQMATNLEHVN
jgi:hypothetical protein